MNSNYSIPSLFLWLLMVASASAESPIRPGDRIAIIGNTFADQLRIHGYLETLLLQQSRENPVSIRNLGWGGDMLTARDRPTGFPAEESTLAAHETDVIIACFGMGESFAGKQGLEGFKSQLQALIDSHRGKVYNGESEVRLILVSPIACEDLGELTPGQDKRNRELEAYTQVMNKVATEADVPFVDLFEESRYLMDERKGPKLTNNGIHLGPYGYWAISHSFYNQLIANGPFPDRQSWLLRVDAKTESNTARGVKISEITSNKSGLSFQVTEESAPTLPPPTNQPLPPQLQSVRDTLVIENLEPGDYRLVIDNQPVATASAQTWANGVAIDSSPAHKASEEYRADVNNKNLQFTYSWKALNQVHIVGERRKSPSGRSLPEEVIEFNRIANNLDEDLRKGMEPKKRHWRIYRISE